ncbi:MAG: MerR family DNA-binding transcriptional regulator [Proteobacteria bacterium]|nr:MerR family DNA-binding transcriptional regulator [Pseudomonadota bacterium]
MEKLSEYVLTKEAAEYLGVSQNTLRTWAEDGKIAVRRNPANGYRLFLGFVFQFVWQSNPGIRPDSVSMG